MTRTTGLFSYGTLRDPQVQLAVFGRTLTETADALVGFVRDTIDLPDPDTGASVAYPILRPSAAAGEIAGAVLEVDDEDLRRADLYEGAAYRRIRVTLASGRDAFVYVAS